MADQELAAMVLKQITTHPETHYQGMWARELSPARQLTLGVSCNTQMCVAGWAVHFADAAAEPDYMGTSTAWYVRNGDGVREPYNEAGRKALDITVQERDYLFDTDRTQDEVIAALTDLVETGHLTPYGYGDEY
jgi:hypothetical protein